MTSFRKIKVYIADDHPVVRKGLKEIIDESDDIELIGEGTNGMEAYHYILEQQPEIAILDIEMPVYNGLEVIKLTRSKQSYTRYIILTMHNDEYHYNEAVSVGVQGYLVKQSVLNELAECIRKVADGHTFVSAKVNLANMNSTNPIQILAEKHKLTPAELNILKMVSKGHTNKQMAEVLFVSEKAIEAHRTNCIRKLGIPPGKNALIKYLIENKYMK